MSLKRLFTTETVKGTKHYLDSQKKYEWIRTAIYFAISLSLFASGVITTGTRNNLLTIVAVLGCLPASKSLVEAVIYSRYHSLNDKDADMIEEHSKGLYCLYDLVFTSREKTYPVPHLVVRGNTIVGFMPNEKLLETDCAKHLDGCLKIDNFKDVSIKLFGDIHKYTGRLEQLKELSEDEALSMNIGNTLKSVSL